MADIKFEEIMKVDFTGFFHHVVPDIISKNSKKYRSNIVEALNISEIWVVAEKIIQYHQYIILSLFPWLDQKDTGEFC